MSDTQRCEPPEHLRGVDGWHWVLNPDAQMPVPTFWWGGVRMWAHRDVPRNSQHAAVSGYRYVAPVTPPSTVAALVEALEAADQFIRNGIELGYIRMPSPSTPDPALETPDKVANALALYRGEVA